MFLVAFVIISVSPEVSQANSSAVARGCELGVRLGLNGESSTDELV